MTIAVLMPVVPTTSAVRPGSVVLTAPYKGGSSSSAYSVNTESCGKVNVTAAKWTAATGGVTAAIRSSAHTCASQFGPVKGLSVGSAETAVLFAVPFHVATNGSHLIADSWTVTIKGSKSAAIPTCPAKNIDYHPPIYHDQNAGCSVDASISFGMSVEVLDLNNRSWTGNSSYAYQVRETYFYNTTYCYNYSKTQCTNATVNSSYTNGGSSRASGFSAFSWSGTTPFTTWTNGTGMVKTHRYYLFAILSLIANAACGGVNLVAAFPASAVASINLATNGNVANLTALRIS